MSGWSLESRLLILLLRFKFRLFSSFRICFDFRLIKFATNLIFVPLILPFEFLTNWPSSKRPFAIVYAMTVNRDFVLIRVRQEKYFSREFRLVTKKRIVVKKNFFAEP